MTAVERAAGVGAGHARRESREAWSSRASGRRLTLLAVALASVLALAAGGAPTAFAEQRCPGTATGTAVVDWGYNASEMLGAGYGSGHEASPNTVLGLTGVRSAKSGFEFGLALMANCTLETWGYGREGQLGDGNNLFASHPVSVVTTEGGLLEDVKEIAAGGSHGIALRYDGTVWTWGTSEFGTRGNGESGWERIARQQHQKEPSYPFEPRNEATEVPGLTKLALGENAELGHAPGQELEVTQIASGGKHDYALLNNGEVLAWGDDHHGQLGVGSEHIENCYGPLHEATPDECVTRPRLVKGLSGVKVERIAAGQEAAFVIAAKGTQILAWGENGSGQLGNGTTEDATTPVTVDGTWPFPVREIASDGAHTLARLADGSVYSWGSDENGALGFVGPCEPKGNEECKPLPVTTPTRAQALAHVVEVAAGEANSLAVVEGESGEKSAYSFGRNGRDELLGLGEASFNQSSKLATPTQIPNLPPVAAVSIANATALAVVEGQGPERQLSVEPKEGELKFTTYLGSVAPNKALTITLRSASGGSNIEKAELPECEAAAKPACAVHVFKDLAPEPYKVGLVTTTNRLEANGKYAKDTRSVTATPLPLKGAPVNVPRETGGGLPSIESREAPTSLVREGHTAVALPGSWSPAASAFEYEWLRCKGYGQEGAQKEYGESCEPIVIGESTGPHGEPVKEYATGGEYTPGEADLYGTLIVRVKAEDAAGTSVALSQPKLVLGPSEEEEPVVPRNVAAPTLSGTGKVGETLEVASGEWEPSSVSVEDRWYACHGQVKAPGEEGVELTEEQEEEESGGGCVPVKELNKEGKREAVVGSRYQVASEYAGKYIEVKEKALDARGWTAAYTRAIAIEGPPSNETPPSIVNSEKEVPQPPEAGEQLTASRGKWTTPTKSPQFQWYRCKVAAGGCACPAACTAIEGATHQTYVPTPEDGEYELVVSESVENANASGYGRSETVYSPPTAEVPKPAGTGEEAHRPEDITPPSIEGTLAQGETLTVVKGTWTETPYSFGYQWKRCREGKCEPIHAAVHPTYTLTAADVGATIEVSEKAKNLKGGITSVSAQTATVIGSPPVVITPPAISGTAQVGQQLAAVNGVWKNEPSGTPELLWKRCPAGTGECETIDNAKGEPETGSTYVVREGDLHAKIELQETVHNATAASATAQTSEVLPPAPVEQSAPALTGGAVQGQTLTASTGSWSNTPTSYTYAWLRCAQEICRQIEGATGETYVLGHADVGSTIAVRVTAHNAGGWGAATSSATEAVAAAPLPSVTRLEPEFGADAGGTRVKIVGENLDETSAVHFGAALATVLEVQAGGGAVIAEAPAGEGTVEVTVATPSGTSAASSGDHFTYLPRPTVTSLSPNRTPAGEATVTISGSGLTDVTSVMFGAKPATLVSEGSGSVITVVAPSQTGGVVNVTVATPGGTSATGAGSQFLYEQAPEFGRCQSVTAGTGAYSGASCDTKSSRGSYEWEPALARTGIELGDGAGEVKLESASKKLVSCSGVQGSGSYRAPNAQAETIVLTGCEYSKAKCSSAGAGAGEVRSVALLATLAWEQEQKKVLLLFAPEGAGEALWSMRCAGTSITVKGSALVAPSTGKMLATQSLKFKTSKGKQAPSEYEGAKGQVVSGLEASFNGEAYESIGLVGTVVQTSEESVEIDTNI